MPRGPTITWTDNEGNEHKINELHKRFADEYLGNGYDALKAYKTVYQDNNRNCARVFKYADTQEYINYWQKEYFEMLNVNKYRVAEKLCQIAFAEKGDADYQTTHQIKALELLAKCSGLFENEKIDHTNQIKITLD